MENKKTRLPAFPLVTSDPFLSIWSCADDPTQDDTRHWAGDRKRMHCTLTVDGQPFNLLGRQHEQAAACVGAEVTPTRTTYRYEAAGVSASLHFRAPLLMDDFDLLSMPVTFVELSVRSADGGKHTVAMRFALHDDICYDGETPQPMVGDAYPDGEMRVAYMGKKQQNLLRNSGDHVTIDWGYAYMASTEAVSFERIGGHCALVAGMTGEAGAGESRFRFLLAYDDVASINYFGYIAKAWYARDGRSIIDALRHCHRHAADIQGRCEALDAQLLRDARACGGEAYAALVAAAYRQSIAAHKLIADRECNPVFLSKENDSNGCAGTADVSYPSIPLYLLYAPELVRAMCRPILRFAESPAWKADFAPHDVGRYPHVTGQVYGLRGDAYGSGVADGVGNGESFPPLYLYNTDRDLYELKYQMPVEECGNMILMLAAAMRADGEGGLARAHLPTLEKWARYLADCGEDPGEQLCTDDFAGHLAHNVNLALKAVCGVAAYAWMLEKLGESGKAGELRQRSRAMAAKVYARAKKDGYTALTLDGRGWSLKYNAVWDLLFGFGLWEGGFFAGEVAHYRKMSNTYGVPLDSRADYAKSDWILWAAAMGDPADVEALCGPVARYLAETPSRKPFSDWYDTKTGAYCAFIARSVQGGVFMPLLRERWR